MKKTAEYAHKHGFSIFTSCLGISRLKDMNQINGCGHRKAEKYDDVVYWDYNWRKEGGSQRMIEISKVSDSINKNIVVVCILYVDSNNWRPDTSRL